MEDKKQITAEDRVEKQRLLYDLAYKQWSNYHKEIPDSLRDRAARLIAPVSASFVFAPTLIKSVIESGLEPQLLYLFSILSAIPIVSLIYSIIIFAGILNTKLFSGLNQEDLREVVEEEDMTLETAYKNVVNHIVVSTGENRDLAISMAKKYRRAFNSFLLAVISGVSLYIILSFAK